MDKVLRRAEHSKQFPEKQNHENKNAYYGFGYFLYYDLLYTNNKYYFDWYGHFNRNYNKNISNEPHRIFETITDFG